VLPPLDEELKQPKKRIDLKALRPQAQADDTEIAENSRTLGNHWGASTSLAGGPPSALTQPVDRSPLASLRIEVPTYLDDALTQKAAALRVTKQFLVLTALREAGYHIADTDIVADKRKARRKGREKGPEQKSGD
jgi:hypothetical protein